MSHGKVAFFDWKDLMKRGNGEGTIYQRKDGRWCGAYYDNAPYPERHYVYGKPQKEVRKKIREKQMQVARGEVEPDMTYTLEQWMKYYMDNYKKNELKKSTFTTYLITIHKHIDGSKFGRTKLGRITGLQLQEYYNKKLDSGLNVKSVKHITGYFEWCIGKST